MTKSRLPKGFCEADRGRKVTSRTRFRRFLFTHALLPSLVPCSCCVNEQLAPYDEFKASSTNIGTVNTGSYRRKARLKEELVKWRFIKIPRTFTPMREQLLRVNLVSLANWQLTFCEVQTFESFELGIKSADLLCFQADLCESVIDRRGAFIIVYGAVCNYEILNWWRCKQVCEKELVVFLCATNYISIRNLHRSNSQLHLYVIISSCFV